MPDIILLQEDDFEEIVGVWENSVSATHDFLTPQEIAFYKPLILEYQLKELRLFGIKDAKIELLFLHSQSIGKGLGFFLVDYVIKRYSINKVDCNEENPKALRFYQRLGFIIISRDETDERGKPHPILHLSL